MQNSKNIIVVLLIVLAAGGWLLYKNNVFKSATNKPLDSQPFSATSYPNDELPPNIPADLPNISSGQIVLNISANNPVTAGPKIQQSTRKLVLPGTLASNKNLYSEYMEKNGYAVTATSSDTTVFLTGTKNTNTLNIIISNYKMATGTSVTIHSLVTPNQ